MHPEIYNSNISMDEKLFLQNQLEKFGGDFDKLLQDMEKYAALPDVEDYENAAKIRDYRKTIKINPSKQASAGPNILPYANHKKHFLHDLKTTTLKLAAIKNSRNIHKLVCS